MRCGAMTFLSCGSSKKASDKFLRERHATFAQAAAVQKGLLILEVVAGNRESQNNSLRTLS